MRKIITILLLLIATAISAQELNCKITVNSSKIEGTSKSLFTNLENALNQFINSYKFTNQVYAVNEKIDCNIVIIVSSVENDIIKTEMQIQASRPVYNTSYSTTILNVRDRECNFKFVEFDQVDLNTSTYDQNISAILAYYAYIIIGLDLDSYQRLGGTSCFAQAEQIVSACQSKTDAEGSGWKAFDSDRNRYALASNLNDDRFRPMREYWYEYHRLAFDRMTENPSNARNKIAEGISCLRDLNRAVPSAAFIHLFLDAKSDEIVNVFTKHGSEQERRSVYDILTAVNPASGNRYDSIIK